MRITSLSPFCSLQISTALRPRHQHISVLVLSPIPKGLVSCCPFPLTSTSFCLSFHEQRFHRSTLLPNRFVIKYFGFFIARKRWFAIPDTAYCGLSFRAEPFKERQCLLYPPAPSTILLLPPWYQRFQASHEMTPSKVLSLQPQTAQVSYYAWAASISIIFTIVRYRHLNLKSRFAR